MYIRLFSGIGLFLLFSLNIQAQEPGDSADTFEDSIFTLESDSVSTVTDTSDAYNVILDTDTTKYDSFVPSEFEDFESFEERTGEDELFDSFQFSGNPSIELTYGINKNRNKYLDDILNKTGSIGLKLGYMSSAESRYNILNFKHKYFFLSSISDEFKTKEPDERKLSSKAWQFGLGSQEAYGYKLGDFSIIPFTSNSIAWTRLKIGPEDDVITSTSHDFSEEEVKRLEMFNGTFRYGTITEGGIKLQYSSMFSLNASYQKSIVFPRCMFWKYLGSTFVEVAATGALDLFVSQILKSVPAAAPLVNFLLKNSMSFALYQLRSEKMNWPFSTDEPFTINTFNVGMTFIF